MRGSTPGQRSLVRQTKGAQRYPTPTSIGPDPWTGDPGLVPHMLTTGLDNLYEGYTISTIQQHGSLTPVVFGSAGNLVCAVYDRGGQRMVLNTGFTRMWPSWWESTGTARYVINSVVWLVNRENDF